MEDLRLYMGHADIRTTKQYYAADDAVNAPAPPILAAHSKNTTGSVDANSLHNRSKRIAH